MDETTPATAASPAAGDAPARRGFLAGLATPTGAMAVFWAALSSFMLAWLWVILRIQGKIIHPMEVGFFATVFAFLILLPVSMRGGTAVWRTRRLGSHFIRAAFNGSGILLWFTALTLLPLADAAGLNLMMPLLTILAAMIFLGENVGPRRWAALVIGLLGAAVIVRPGLQEVGLGVWLVFISMGGAVGQRIIAKTLTRTDSSTTCTLYLMLFMIPVTGAGAAFVWTTPALSQIPWFIAAGALLVGAHFAFIHSIALADVSALEPVNFTRLVWASLLGFAFFAEVPDVWVFVGGALIIGATTYIAHRESVLRRQGAASALKAGLDPEAGV